MLFEKIKKEIFRFEKIDQNGIRAEIFLNNYNVVPFCFVEKNLNL
jgi:glycopeptide antibiotics resistance protein